MRALKFYDRAQQEFYLGTSHEIMLFQARAHYENQNLIQAKKALQEALHIAPMNHRIRFNLAYVVQELAQRWLNDMLKCGLFRRSRRTRRKGLGEHSSRATHVYATESARKPTKIWFRYETNHRARKLLQASVRKIQATFG